jgi:hypothetical protein
LKTTTSGAEAVEEEEEDDEDDESLKVLAKKDVVLRRGVWLAALLTLDSYYGKHLEFNDDDVLWKEQL